MSIGNFLENKILDYVYKGTAFTVNPTYVSLHTADPGETGASEVTGASYARQQVAAAGWAVAASGATSNLNVIQFVSMPAVTVTHVGIWDALSGGNFLWGGALTASRVVEAGQTARIPIGDLDISLD